MKKIAIAAVAIVLIASLPVVMGWVVKNRLENTMDTIQLSQTGLLMNDTYHLGWLSSHATLNIANNTSTNKIPAIEDDVIVHHGPIISYQDEQGHTQWFFGLALLEFKLPQFAKNSGYSLDFNQKAYTNTLRIGFDLRRDTHIDATALKGVVYAANKPIATINLDKFIYDNSTSYTVKTKHHQTLIRNLHIDAGTIGFLDVPQLDHETTYHLLSGAFLGNSSLWVPNLTASLPSQNLQFKMERLAYSINGEKQQDSVNYRVAASLHRALYNNQSYGPFVLDLQLNHVNFQALSKIIRYQPPSPSMVKFIGTKAAEKRALSAGLTALSMIQANTQFTLKQFDLTLPQGSLHLNFNVLAFQAFPTTNLSTFLNAIMENHPDDSDLDTMAATVRSDIINFQKNVDITLHLDMDHDLFLSMLASYYPSSTMNDLNDMAQRMEQARLITENNGVYSVNIRMLNNDLYLNDQPLNTGMSSMQ